MKKLNSTGTCYEAIINNIIVYYSYSTPVAFSKNGGTYVYGTSKKYSVTTSKHMTKYIGVDKKIPEEEFKKELYNLTGVN